MPHRTPVATAALLTLPLLCAPAFADTYNVLTSLDPITPLGNNVSQAQGHPLLLNGHVLFTGVDGGAHNAGSLGDYNIATNQLSTLYSFTDNSFKYGGVTLAPDGLLYGASYTSGILYRIAPDGTGYQTLYTRSGNDTGSVTSPLAISGTSLFGYSAAASGTNGRIFSMSTDGSNYQIIHSFGFSDNPPLWAGLTVSGSTLYGTSGSDIYKMNTDGSGYTSLVDSPRTLGLFNTTLILSANTLYGMGGSKGANGGGGVFSVNTDGSNFTHLHDFNAGDTPADSLYLLGNTLYGMTQMGGDNNDGYIFSVNTDGSNYQLLHTFAGGATDGLHPRGSFVFDPDTNALYATTLAGGANNTGILFSITVPEPASLSLLTLATPLLLRRRKSR